MSAIELVFPRVGQTADDAYGTTLMDVLDQGYVCRQEKGSQSVGSGRESREILNYSVRIGCPRERLVFNAKRRLNLPAAIARFVWMMAGSDRLADIAFYEEKVRFFSDNGISVPGSNYGQRMLSPSPGLNQLDSIIKRLKEDPASRRAAISIYQAEDAVRSSKDIPCTFGLFYHIREGTLLATTVMRSNNAFILLPYNIFEFSLLAEVVAAELNVPLGPMTHHALSMHVYESDYANAKEVVEAWRNHSIGSNSFPVPEMPKTPSSLEQIRQLVILEAELRHGSAGLKGGNIEDWINKGSEVLHPFWGQLYFLLLLYVAKKNHDQKALAALESAIEDPWHSYLPPNSFREGARGVPVSELTTQQAGPLSSMNVVPLFSSRAMKSLKSRVAEWEKKSDKPLSWGRYAKVQEILLETLAARGGEGFEGEISSEDFEAAVRSVSDANAE
jgi:thymidylate synthase